MSEVARATCYVTEIAEFKVIYSLQMFFILNRPALYIFATGFQRYDVCSPSPLLLKCV